MHVGIQDDYWEAQEAPPPVLTPLADQ
jgi:hypothetical protein